LRLLDTVVLAGALNPADRYHTRAEAHLEGLSREPQLFIPAVVLIEFDLLMKARGYSPSERHETWFELTPKIPTEKILSPTTVSAASAALLEQDGLAYFDALVAAQAQELDAEVVTTDQAMARHVSTIW